MKILIIKFRSIYDLLLNLLSVFVRASSFLSLYVVVIIYIVGVNLSSSLLLLLSIPFKLTICTKILLIYEVVPDDVYLELFNVSTIRQNCLAVLHIIR